MYVCHFDIFHSCHLCRQAKNPLRWIPYFMMSMSVNYYYAEVNASISWLHILWLFYRSIVKLAINKWNSFICCQTQIIAHFFSTIKIEFRSILFSNPNHVNYYLFFIQNFFFFKRNLLLRPSYFLDTFEIPRVHLVSIFRIVFLKSVQMQNKIKWICIEYSV